LGYNTGYASLVSNSIGSIILSLVQIYLLVLIQQTLSI